MNYVLKIIIDDLVKKPYAIVSLDELNDDMISVEVHTSKKEKLDFKKMDFTTFLDANILDEFLLYFSYGKDVISNAYVITVSPKAESIDPSLKFNDIIYTYLNNNQDLLKHKNIIINAGVYDYDQNEYNHIDKFLKYDNVNFLMSNLNDLLPVKKIGASIRIINEITNEVKKHPDLSPLERSMYAFDLLRINLAKTPDNNSREEKEINDLVDSYVDPSDFYPVIYNEILNKINVKSVCANGEFYADDIRRFVVSYIDDDKYGIEGVYYHDIAYNSVQNVKKSLSDALPDMEEDNPILDTLKIYNGFAKTKSDMEQSGFLNYDYMFADFNESYLNLLDQMNEKINSNVKSVAVMNINNVSHFIDGTNIITSKKVLDDEDRVEELKTDIERYLEIFNNEICAEDFLEILFNVRKIEHQYNKDVFKLTTDGLKDILYNSRVNFTNSHIAEELEGLDEDDEEEVEEIIRDDIESNFEEFSIKNDISNKIMKLKLSMYIKEEQERKNKEDKNK